jgi:hypothetical protein
MREFITSHFEHVLCGLIFIARVGDILSTFLVTPKLMLEANPIAQKLGWRFAVLTIFICLVPYYSTTAGIIVLVPSLLVSASNTAKIWFVRALGEIEYLNLLYRLARTTKLSHALAGIITSALFIALAGFVLLFLAPDPNTNWGYWYAVGILLYAFVIGFYGSIYAWLLFRAARRGDFPHTKEA